MGQIFSIPLFRSRSEKRSRPRSRSVDDAICRTSQSDFGSTVRRRGNHPLSAQSCGNFKLTCSVVRGEKFDDDEEQKRARSEEPPCTRNGDREETCSNNARRGGRQPSSRMSNASVHRETEYESGGEPTDEPDGVPMEEMLAREAQAFAKTEAAVKRKEKARKKKKGSWFKTKEDMDDTGAVDIFATTEPLFGKPSYLTELAGGG